MSDPKPAPAIPRFFQPMMHNDDYASWDLSGWGATWGPAGSVQQRFAPQIPPYDQGETPLVLRELAARAVVTPIDDSMVVISPPSGAVAAATSTATAKLTFTISEDPAPRIARAPAARLISVLAFVLTRSAYERIIAPYIAQEQHEHYEALLRKEFRRAGFIVARMYLMTIFIGIRALLAPLVRLFVQSGRRDLS